MLHRSSWLLLVLTPLLFTGCDSNDSRNTGSFRAEVRGDLTRELDGSAQLHLQNSTADGEPASFELVLTAQQSEISIQSMEGSGAPETTVYDIEGAASSDSSHVVRVVFRPDRFGGAASERFEAYAGVLTITRATDLTVEGEFNFDAAGTTNPNDEVIIVGQFTAER